MLKKNQISALKYLISVSKEGTTLTKRILWFLLDNFSGKGVCITLTEGKGGFTKKEIQEAAFGLGRMQSVAYSTHLGAIMRVTGRTVFFDFGYGNFDSKRGSSLFNSDGQFAGAPLDTVLEPGYASQGMPLRYTFWLSKEGCYKKAELLKATKRTLNKIDLKNSGLYPHVDGSA